MRKFIECDFVIELEVLFLKSYFLLLEVKYKVWILSFLVIYVMWLEGMEEDNIFINVVEVVGK